MEFRENEYQEFKKSTSELREGVISMAAMLNKHGAGKVFFGIKNDGTVVGQTIGTDTTRTVADEFLREIKPRITPQLDLITMDGKQVIQVTADGSDTPYTAYGRYYMRTDDMDVQMSNDALGDYFEKKRYPLGSWERQSSGKTVECIDEDRLIWFMRASNELNRLSDVYTDVARTLMGLGLLCEDGTVNMAGYYLFSNDRAITLKLASFVTDECLEFSNIGMKEGNIFDCIEAGEQYIKDHMDWRAEIEDIRRKEIPEVPVKAVREIVVNSFCHMKFGAQPYNQIHFTPTRIHISNPGGFPSGRSPEMFAERQAGSVFRNPLIARTLYLCGLVEAFGTGFRRVFNECQSQNVQFRYSISDYDFVFEFLRKKNDRTNVPQRITESESLILDELSKDGSMTIPELSDITGMSKAEVYNRIRDLRNNGIITREGSRKRGRWAVNL